MTEGFGAFYYYLSSYVESSSLQASPNNQNLLPAGEIQEELNDINADIELKTKLIEQLELSQQRIQVMRQQYEEKLNVLNAKIQNTQKERDQVLANMGAGGGQASNSQPSDKVRKVREEYERKLHDMQRELRRLQDAQKEHIRQQRELQIRERKLRELKTELTELKCAKTRLIKKMNEETNRHKAEESKKAREIAQLRKESRKQQSAVKSLQAQVAAKDQILKRKTEQVTALRKSFRSGQLSVKAQGRVPAKKIDSSTYNPRQARTKWDNLHRNINRAARSRQVVNQLEKELERLINERESLSKEISTVRSRQR